MQISRHWRLNSQRYRLEGVRYVNGEVRLQARVLSCPEPQPQPREMAKVQERTATPTGR